MVVFLGSLSWIAYVWGYYIRIDIYGAILGVFAGIFYIYIGHDLSKLKLKKYDWIYGWDDEIFGRLIRVSFLSSLFFGPIIKHGVETLFSEHNGVKYSLSVAVVGSIIIAFVLVIYIDASD